MILNVKGAVITACVCVMSVNFEIIGLKIFDYYQIALGLKSIYRLLNIEIQLFHNLFT